MPVVFHIFLQILIAYLISTTFQMMQLLLGRQIFISSLCRTFPRYQMDSFCRQVCQFQLNYCRNMLVTKATTRWFLPTDWGIHILCLVTGSCQGWLVCKPLWLGLGSIFVPTAAINLHQQPASSWRYSFCPQDRWLLDGCRPVYPFVTWDLFTLSYTVTMIITPQKCWTN